MPNAVQNKVALITGSTSGIGKAAAELLARQGFNVAVTGKEQDREQGEILVKALLSQGHKAIFTAADLQEPQAPEDLVSRTVAEWGRLDIVVNNAAQPCHKPLAEITHADWNRLFSINLKAPFFLIQAALPWLKISSGAIINVSSINAINNSHSDMIYDAMKAALNHMTRGLAIELRENGIRCNAIMPGATATPAINEWYRQKFVNVEDTNSMAEAAKMDPHVAQPMQIAEAIAFLAGQSSAWINGAAIPVDGGYGLG